MADVNHDFTHDELVLLIQALHHYLMSEVQKSTAYDVNFAEGLLLKLNTVRQALLPR
jgi:hypothetical protein